MKTNDIRNAFLNFFKNDNHEVVSSSPLVPQNDPTLLFTNAGMVQFKDVFTGNEKRDYTRAVTSQKCVRAGGKHNDLENVGYTARHHTFFEMLGNFSFGDYFKEHAIEMAWNFITKEIGLEKEKLLVTVYHEDEQAADFWKKIAGIGDDKIIRIATSDNFWSMGDTGPCGPCSEIFYDHGDHIPGGPPGSPDEDGDRFIEIWNLVFMQYEQMAEGNRVDLPSPSIDTGMGLERIAAVLQHTNSNYEIDMFKNLIENSANLTNTDPSKVSHKVIADHLRSGCFLMADGVLPSNEGRGYVLRRILRRAMRHAHLLGYNDSLMWQLVPGLIAEMGDAYPELGRAQSLITQTLRREEDKFRETLARGIKLLEEETSKLSSDTLDGAVAFKLYDTYGFPLDLTQDVLRGKNLKVDEAGFDAAMQEQKQRARAAWSGSGEAANEKLWYDLYEEHGATEFLGYDADTAQGQIIALIKDGEDVKSVKSGDENVIILTNQTPFYGESGGQMGDTGTINTSPVKDTAKKLGKLHAHMMESLTEDFEVGQAVDLNINIQRREALRIHHSATHLVHESLRQNLGDHVAQKGSLVAPERLRFDFTHTQGLSAEEITKIEQDVNAQIRANTSVETKLMSPDAAIEEGAMALFGEKYGDEVRVLTMGKDKYSVELCGGTHVKRTGDVGVFKIISESSVSSGVRRIEAVAGEEAVKWYNDQIASLTDITSTLNVSTKDATSKVQTLLDENKESKAEIEKLKKQIALGGSSGSNDDAQEVNGVKFLGKIMEDIPAKNLRGIADELKEKADVIVLITLVDGKAGLVVSSSSDAHNAVDLVRVGAEALGGKGGGGRPDMAQAGGPEADKSKAESAIEQITKAL